jgi:hypothetical protein
VSIELTDQQRQALQAKPGEPLRIEDSQTNTAYVLLRADEYERLKRLRQEDEDRAERKAWLDTATRARRARIQEDLSSHD